MLMPGNLQQVVQYGSGLRRRTRPWQLPLVDTVSRVPVPRHSVAPQSELQMIPSSWLHRTKLLPKHTSFPNMHLKLFDAKSPSSCQRRENATAQFSVRKCLRRARRSTTYLPRFVHLESWMGSLDTGSFHRHGSQEHLKSTRKRKGLGTKQQKFYLVSLVRYSVSHSKRKGDRPPAEGGRAKQQR
jgi:hypothetical protein